MTLVVTLAAAAAAAALAAAGVQQEAWRSSWREHSPFITSCSFYSRQHQKCNTGDHQQLGLRVSAGGVCARGAEGMVVLLCLPFRSRASCLNTLEPALYGSWSSAPSIQQHTSVMRAGAPRGGVTTWRFHVCKSNRNRCTLWWPTNPKDNCRSGKWRKLSDAAFLLEIFCHAWHHLLEKLHVS